MFYATHSSSRATPFLLVAVMLLGLSGVAWSQTESARVERVNPARPAKQAADDPQRRRAAVRAALEAQREQKSANTETGSRPRRQLSPQERQELREQLRQQRS